MLSGGSYSKDWVDQRAQLVGDIPAASRVSQLADRQGISSRCAELELQRPRAMPGVRHRIRCRRENLDQDPGIDKRHVPTLNAIASPKAQLNALSATLLGMRTRLTCIGNSCIV